MDSWNRQLKSIQFKMRGFSLLGSAESRVKCYGWRLGSLDKRNGQREHEGAIVPKVWELCESRLNSIVKYIISNNDNQISMKYW